MTSDPKRADVAAAIAGLPPLKRLTPYMSLQDCVVALAEGNPGALSVMMQALTTGPVHPINPAGMVFLHDLDQADVTGSQIYLLAQYAGSPLRAAALVASCVNFRLPTVDELHRDLAEYERDRRKTLSRVLEHAIQTAGRMLPQFAGMDLRRPEGGPRG